MTDHLTVIRNPGGLSFRGLIAGDGERAAWRFAEFFTVNIRNRNTRAAYGRAAAAFLGWCEGQGITSLAEVLPMHVAAYSVPLGHPQNKEAIRVGHVAHGYKDTYAVLRVYD